MPMRPIFWLGPLCALAAWWLLARGKVVGTATSATAAASSTRATSGPWAHAPSLRPRPAALVGRVVDPEGGSVPGARVVVVRTPVAEESFPGLIPLAVVSSDGEGRFRIEQLGLTATVMVSATSRGWTSAAVAAVLRPGVEATVELRLGRDGGVFYGRVTDGPDSPVVATVAVLGGNDAVYQVECDTDGRYELGLPPAAWLLGATADGYAPWWEDDQLVLAVGERVRMDIELRPETALRVRVVDEKHRPVVGAVVLAARKELGRTDERGELMIRNPDDDTTLTVHSGTLCGNGTVVRPSVGEGELEVVVSRGSAALGVVVDERDQPIAGASVTADGDTTTTVSVGADGTFVIDGLCNGGHQLEGRVGETRRGVADALVWDGQMEESRRTTIVVKQAYDFRLTVRGADRQPLAGARVWLDSGPAHTDARGQLAWTGQNVTVSVDNPRTGASLNSSFDGDPSETSVNELLAEFPSKTKQGRVRYEDGAPAAGIAVRADGIVTRTRRDGRFTVDEDATYVLDAFVVEKDEQTNELVIQRASSQLSGRVLGPGGEPLWGASVRATPEGDLREYGQMPTVRTGSDGRFVINGLAQGNYGIVVHHPDFDDLTVIEQPTGREVTARMTLPPVANTEELTND